MMGFMLAAADLRSLLGDNLSVSLKIVVILTILTVLPSIILMTTSFIRVVIVLSFVRRALGTQQLPPNQVIVGLSLFLTFMIMAPTWTTVWNNGLEPYLENQIDEQEAIDRSMGPIRHFMLQQIDRRDLGLFVTMTQRNLSGRTRIKLADVDTTVLVPAFMTSELKRAFKMGFLIYLPFVVVDLVVASVLISMGMMMLPPVLISLPFKVLIFVLVDGWGLIVGKLAESFLGG